MILISIGEGGDNTLSDIQRGVIKDSIKKVQETCKSISSQHKDLHGAVSKIGRAIDKVGCSVSIINAVVN